MLVRHLALPDRVPRRAPPPRAGSDYGGGGGRRSRRMERLSADPGAPHPGPPGQSLRQAGGRWRAWAPGEKEKRPRPFPAPRGWAAKRTSGRMTRITRQRERRAARRHSGSLNPGFRRRPRARPAAASRLRCVIFKNEAQSDGGNRAHIVASSKRIFSVFSQNEFGRFECGTLAKATAFPGSSGWLGRGLA